MSRGLTRDGSQPRARVICMLGTDPAGAGGVASVIASYEEVGLSNRWPLRLLATHSGGAASAKLVCFSRALFVFIGLLLRGEVALVHAHASSYRSFYRKSVFLVLARMFGVPAMAHIHGGGFEAFCGAKGGWVTRHYSRFVLRGCVRVLVVSPPLARFLVEIVGKEKVVMLPNGVIPVGSNTTEQGNRPALGGAGAVLFLGRLSSEKGIFDLIRAIAGLADDGIDVELWACGDGDPEAAGQLCEMLGISHRVRLLGWVAGDRKRSVLTTASVFCLPSYTEGLPTALLDAMGAGLPVVATRVGAVPDVVTEGEEGLLVDPGDVPGLVLALRRMLSDETGRLAMSANAARRVATEYDQRRLVRSLERIYTELGVTPTVRTPWCDDPPESGSLGPASRGSPEDPCGDSTLHPDKGATRHQ